MNGRGKSIPILMYHYIGDTDVPSEQVFWTSTKRFREQMRFLKRGGYQTVTLSALVRYFEQQHPLPRRPIVITFDDGHTSFSTRAVPILLEFGFFATNFIITGRIGDKGFLTSSDILRLREAGMAFESHSVSHPILTQQTDADIHNEVVGSKHALEDLMNAPVDFFAYRGGHYNEAVKTIVAGAGYRAALSTEAGLNSAQTDRYALKRMRIRRSDDLMIFARKLTGNNIPFKSMAYAKHWLRI